MPSEIKQSSSCQSAINESVIKLQKECENLFGGVPRRPYQRLKALNNALIALKHAVNDDTISILPLKLVLSNTQTCNLRCPFCGSHGTDDSQHKYNDRRNDLEFNYVLRIAEEALPYVDKVWFSVVGEGLNVKISEIQAYTDLCRKYGNHLEIVTNGTLLDPLRVAAILPVCRHILFSFDGASPLVFEAIRLNASFDKVVRNIKRLTLACEYLPLAVRPTFEMKITICGSNVQELPRIIELAKFMGISKVYANFVILMEDHKHIEHELMEYHKGRYNYYRQEAENTALSLEVEAVFTPPFPDVECDPRLPENRDKMIVKSIPDDYYEKLPLPESLFDPNVLKMEALEIAFKSLTQIISDTHKMNLREDAVKEQELEQKAAAVLKDTLALHQDTLKAMNLNPSARKPDCWLTFRDFDICNDGKSRICCMGPTQFDIVHGGLLSSELKTALDKEEYDLRQSGSNVRKVFNNSVCALIARKIHTGKPAAWCKNCEAYVMRMNIEFINDLLASGVVALDSLGCFVVRVPFKVIHNSLLVAGLHPESIDFFEGPFLEKWKYLNDKYKKLVVYGAGKFTLALISILRSNALLVPEIIWDDAPKTSEVYGVTVKKTPARFPVDIDAVILGTDTYQTMMSARLNEISGIQPVIIDLTICKIT